MVCGTIFSHRSATSSMVRLCGRMHVLVTPPWLVLGSWCVGNCVKYGSSIISSCLVSPSASLTSDPWADVEYFLEEVTLYSSGVGDFCPEYCDLVSCIAPFVVPQSGDFVVQVLDTSFDRTDQELFGRI